MNSCKEYGLPTPKLEEQNDFMDIEIVRSQDNLQTIKSKIRPITDDYGQLRPIISSRKAITIRLPPNSQKRSCSIIENRETKSKELFNQLLSKKLIERIGKGRATFYKLRKKQV